ncbi:MAG: LysM peptidoglycan-binding domain-containing protein [Acidobacteriota bacterium]
MVTLKGVAASRDVRNQVMKGFTELVKADSTVNGMTVDEPKAEAPKPAAVTAKADPPASATASAQSVVLAPAAPAAAAPAERRHVVVKGETLSAIAKQYYGKASAYPKIFEANRDILKDADHIQVGQSLRIPE